MRRKRASSLSFGQSRSTLILRPSARRKPAISRASAVARWLLNRPGGTLDINANVARYQAGVTELLAKANEVKNKLPKDAEDPAAPQAPAMPQVQIEPVVVPEPQALPQESRCQRILSKSKN